MEAILLVLLLTSITVYFNKKYPGEQYSNVKKEIQLTETEVNAIESLAEQYINKVITLEHPEIDQDDNTNFYELVKQNNLLLPEQYNKMSSYYKVRNILYKTSDYMNFEIKKKLRKLKQEKDAKLKENFDNFLDETKPYVLKYVKTFFPTDNSLPSDINLNLDEKQVTAFIYLLENNYKIKIPNIKSIVYDTLFLSDNTLDFLRNILYASPVKNRKDCIVNFAISYIYALEIYEKFENKLTDNGENVDKDFSNLVQKYLALFNTDFIYVDLLLEYMQKYKIEIPELPQNERSYYDKALYMFDNKLEHLIIPNGNLYITDIYNDMIEHEYLYDEYDDEYYDEEKAYDESCMEKYYNQNYKYLNLLAHILKELELTEVRKDANNILVRIESNGNSPQSTENMQKRDADWWMSLSPWDFEKEVAKVFKKQGYNVKVTRGSGDGGVDLFLTKDSYNIIVQCKQYTHPVSPEPLRALWGIKNDYGADKVFLVATAGITSGGENFISNKPDFIVFTLSDIMKMAREK